MKTKSLLFVSIIAALTSCSGQAVPQAGHTERSAEHPTATALSSNIMAVYQDKQNNYWFGSWKDGVYKYDGHTLTHFTMYNPCIGIRIFFCLLSCMCNLLYQ